MKEIKKRPIPTKVYELGKDDSRIQSLFEQGLIKKIHSQYEVFTLESGKTEGQIACEGDFIKVDIKGNIYPTTKEKLYADYDQIEENLFVPKGKILSAWFAEENPCDEILYLIEKGILKLDPTHPEQYFQAVLWGTDVRAAKNAALIFYSIKKDTDGTILEIDFNFVERTIFEQTYIVIET